MPNPMQGLMAAAPTKPLGPPQGDGIEDLINQRLGVNQAISGHPVAPQGVPQVNPQWPGQPQGWHPPMALGRTPAPMTGLEQAQPVAPEMGFDELMKRAQAIPAGR